jgi:ABC-type spermidine/putrescine transport system permease subunit I
MIDQLCGSAVKNVLSPWCTTRVIRIYSVFTLFGIRGVYTTFFMNPRNERSLGINICSTGRSYNSLYQCNA